ncbi:FG-nucleoporin NUP57 [Histomonas meleagridis]|uniref:FG-nucleoporin NUP57 n=1 Tax=Histomonas meleagridis TaxID=135588 RepID=UPI00355ABC04|nr:FG-nucleoporin NUP57 [Histomonas meleagridis]KAH0796245.1 FG-nucleoporin NUP57 [Histomonas meleagridis]
MFGQAAPPPPPSDPLLQRLYKIRDSYDKNSKSFRFKVIVYDTKTTTSTIGNQAPACLTAEQWEQANASVPEDTMKPNVLQDFTDLEGRVGAQEAIIKEMRNKLDDMRTRICELRDEYNEEVTNQLILVSEKNDQINQLLMGVLEVEEINALQTKQFTSEEHQMYDHLEELRSEIDKPNKYVAALNTIRLKSNLLRESMAAHSDIEVSETSLTSAKDVLMMNTKAIKALAHATKKMKNNANNMQKLIDEMQMR